MTETKPDVTPEQDCWAQAQQSPGATDNQCCDAGATPGRSERFANLGALLSAFMASSWCWLPPLLILGGISGAGMTTTLEAYRPIFIAVTIGFLGLAFYLTYRPRPGARSAGRSKIMAMNKAMLWTVTVVAAVFLFCPQYVSGLFADTGEFSGDMHRTVLKVEGMTCPGWVPTAEAALRKAPGVLAVEVDYESKQATIGTAGGEPVPKQAVLAALEEIRYRGEFVEENK